MATIKPQRELSKQAIKRLESMSEDEKVRLLALLEIKKANNQINGILSVGPFVYHNTLRAELVHHLFDENDYDAVSRMPLTKEEYFENKRKTINYKMLVNLFQQQKDIYSKMDIYTAIAYALYYDNFIMYADGVRTIDGFRQAKRDAYHDVRDMADLFQLNLDYVEGDNKKTGSLLVPDYRVALENYLRKEFKLGYKYEAITEFLKDYFTNVLVIDYDIEGVGPQEHYDVYANNVEAYRDEKGNVYYLNADGEIYYPDQVGDYKTENATIKATEDGISVERE